MNILLVSATRAEIAPLLEHLSETWQSNSDTVFSTGNHRLNILITGVGLVSTTYALTKTLGEGNYDLVLQAGLAGSFNRQIALGELVLVGKDCFGDLGAEDHYNFIDVFELGFAEANSFPFVEKEMAAPALEVLQKAALKTVSALSVNMVSGSAYTAQRRFNKYACDLETMEGAAFFFVCLQQKVPAFAQIRAISNYVEARDRSQWKIAEAINSLNSWLIGFLESL